MYLVVSRKSMFANFMCIWCFVFFKKPPVRCRSLPSESVIHRTPLRVRHVVVPRLSFFFKHEKQLLVSTIICILTIHPFFCQQYTCILTIHPFCYQQYTYIIVFSPSIVTLPLIFQSISSEGKTCG